MIKTVSFSVFWVFLSHYFFFSVRRMNGWAPKSVVEGDTYLGRSKVMSKLYFDVSRPCLLTKTRPDSQIKTYVSFFGTYHEIFSDPFKKGYGLKLITWLTKIYGLGVASPWLCKNWLTTRRLTYFFFGNLRCTVYQKLKGKALLAQ